MGLYIYYIIRAITIILVIDIGLSWARMAGARISMSNPIVKFVTTVSDGLCNPIRRIMPHPAKTGNLDFAPMIVMLILSYVGSAVLGL